MTFGAGLGGGFPSEPVMFDSPALIRTQTGLVEKRQEQLLLLLALMLFCLGWCFHRGIIGKFGADGPPAAGSFWIEVTGRPIVLTNRVLVYADPSDEREMMLFPPQSPDTLAPENQRSDQTGHKERLSGAVSLALGRKMDLNRAAVRDLRLLPRVGLKTARSIVLDRKKRGPFTSVDQLKRVKGIGPKKLAAVKTWLTVGPD